MSEHGEDSNKISSSTNSSAGLPRFVEPDYNLETTHHVVKAEDPDPCCTRCTGEWRYDWFTPQEGPKVMDVKESFGPSSTTARLIKFCLMLLFIASLSYKWWTKRDHAAFFLAYLTNWSLIFSTLWTIVSFLNSTILPPAQPKRASDSVSLWIKLCWLLFPVACEFGLMTTMLYWTLDYKPGISVMNYTNVFTHAGVLLIWPEGLVVNRIPVRMKHLPVVMFLAACYVSWMAIHQMATDIGNPNRHDEDPDTNDDLLYTAVDFEEKTTSSSILVILVVLVVTPLCHLVLWSLSLFQFPCNCSGHNRRYIAEGSQHNNSEKAAPTDNVNIYEEP